MSVSDTRMRWSNAAIESVGILTKSMAIEGDTVMARVDGCEASGTPGVFVLVGSHLCSQQGVS